MSDDKFKRMMRNIDEIHAHIKKNQEDIDAYYKKKKEDEENE